MRKGRLIVLLLLLIVPLCLGAQDVLQMFGYFESQFLGAYAHEEFYQLYTNKLRIDLKANLSDKITFAANFDYIVYHGNTEWNILDFLSSEIVSAIPTGMQNLYIIPFSDRTFLDNAYIKIAFKYFDLTVGKQQISLGTGYVWNPTDVFNIKDPLDPTYEQPGHNAIRMDIPIRPGFTLTTLYSPGDSWRQSACLIQLKGRISHFDFSIIAVEKGLTFHDYTRFNLLALNFLEHPERRQVLGGSLAGELLGAGLWAEYAYSRMEISDDFYELVIGIDYTFDFQTYIMAEFYRNTLGKTDFKQYDLNDWMRLFASEQKTISRDQVYCLIQHPMTDLLNFGLSSIYSFSDESLILIPMLTYNLSNNVDIMAYLNFNLGEEGKVFGRNLGNGGLLRARVYF